jgi:hypothetical protein
MKYAWILTAIAALVLTACGSPAEPTMSPADVQGTAMAGAQTMVAETQAAIPTATPIPATETATVTSFPTATFPPLNLTPSTQAVQVGGGTQLATQAVGLPPTSVPTKAPGTGSNDPCNQPLTSWGGQSAQLTLKNNTKPKGVVTASLFFRASFGECGYISAQFDNSTTLKVPVGTFSAGAFVDGPKDFKIFGSGEITRSANYSLWFENESIILKAGCAPNC